MLGDEQNRGVIPLAVDQIFSDITSSANQKQFLIRVSYVEIYNETISDLLVNVSLKVHWPMMKWMMPEDYFFPNSRSTASSADPCGCTRTRRATW